MVQVDRDNVLAVHRAFRDHANELRKCLMDVGFEVQLGLCGGDPVSRDAAGPRGFGGKIATLLDVHWKHWKELDAVANELQQTARTYGHTEDDITQSLAAKKDR